MRLYESGSGQLCPVRQLRGAALCGVEPPEPQPAHPHPEYARIEVRMPDVSCNPYLAFALLLAAGFEGMERKMELAEETPYDLYTANAGALEALPASLEEAIARAGGSAFVEKVLSADTARKYLALKQAEQNRWFAARDKEKYQDEAYFGVL